MTAPSPQDLANADRRRSVADRQNGEYADAERLALAALGPGWKPWMALHLLDADHRETGQTEPVATVYKVFRGEERLSANSMFLRRMPDGTVENAASYEPLFSDLLAENHPTKTIEVRGGRVAARRYELCWSALERYEPRTAESLAAARVKREERAVEKEAEKHPLFAEQIRSEAKPRGRA